MPSREREGGEECGLLHVDGKQSLKQRRISPAFLSAEYMQYVVYGARCARPRAKTILDIFFIFDPSCGFGKVIRIPEMACHGMKVR